MKDYRDIVTRALPYVSNSSCPETSLDEFLNSLNCFPGLQKEIQKEEDLYPKNTNIHHGEHFLAHLLATAEICSCLAPAFHVPCNVAYILGLYHDIGKPLTRFATKKGYMYHGHAQIGAYILERVPELFPESIQKDYREAITWAINHHMCCLSHDNRLPTRALTEMAKGLMLITIPKEIREKAICCLGLLFAADMLGRSVKDMKETTEIVDSTQKFVHGLLESITPVANICMGRQTMNERVVVLQIGLSGSGKTTHTASLYKSLVDMGIRTKVAERDLAYYTVAKEMGIYGTYMEIYGQVVAKGGREKVQAEWCRMLGEALADPSCQCVIIDSVQPFYDKAWTATIESLSEISQNNYGDALKIGLYHVPQSFFSSYDHHEYPSKIGEPVEFPSETLAFPVVGLEQPIAKHIDIAMGCGLQHIHNIIAEYLTADVVPSVLPQVSMQELLDSGKSPNDIPDLFPKGLIQVKEEIRTKTFRITTIGYRDGFQTFTGPTREYRGISVLAYEGKHRVIRPCMPVFPDMVCIEKDPSVFEFLGPVWNRFLPQRKWSSGMTFAQTVREMFLTPKYDGSLFNLVYIPYSAFPDKFFTELKMVCEDRFQGDDAVLFQSLHGVYVVGSKGTMFCKRPVRARIQEAITATYGTMDKLIESSNAYTERKGLRDEITTLHFEAIGTPSPELTVAYDEHFCIFLGATTLSRFHRPYKGDMPRTTEIIDLDGNDLADRWQMLTDIYEQNFGKMLLGDKSIEPEGYVLHIVDTNGKWHPIKFKYDLYYASHKPEAPKHVQTATEIRESQKYALARQRLLKFKDAKDFVEPIKKILQQDFLDYFLPLLANYLPRNGDDEKVAQRRWAGFWNDVEKQNMARIQDIDRKCMDMIATCAGQRVPTEKLTSIIMTSRKAFTLDEITKRYLKQ